jgi:hypothetical protein
MITKILRNTTAENIVLINVFIPAGESVNIEYTLFAKLLQSGVVFELINSGDLVVNDGTKDLSVSEGIAHMYLFQEPSSVTSRNFSYDFIEIGQNITIPRGQQMRVYQECRVDGDLNVYGEIIVKDI